MATEPVSTKTRRTALEQLSRDRLAELTTAHGLAVADRRSTAAHVEALLQAKSSDFATLLRSLKREELQAICDALGLDRGGREKEPLVLRILGEPTPSLPLFAAVDSAPAPAKATAPLGGSASAEPASRSSRGGNGGATPTAKAKSGGGNRIKSSVVAPLVPGG